MAYPIKNYLLEEAKYIKEIDSEVAIYIHERTKAKILLMSNEDPHKSFCIGFRTPPADSTGVAHIIEHSVLCGSVKYPLKDPFVELAKGSLNTYLNAMTYPDKTLYPISSQNDKDFHNLMDVYLDAVFFPNIYKHKEIMMQEGWRYHIEKPEDPIEYKGVVYNEMKGAFSSSEEIGFRMIKETLFPDTTYANESGGAPKNIPDLTYENFINFHKTYYHPSNAYICLYGDMDPAETLAYIDENYLSKFNYLKVDSQIATQAPFKEMTSHKGYYSATEGRENGLFLAYNYVVGDITCRKTMLGMSILEYVLLDTPASPLKKALIAEGIGDDVYGALQTHLKQPVFSVVAKNVAPEKEARFYELVDEMFQKYAKEGLPEHLLKGAMQVKEFEMREGDASGYSKGLFYALASMKSWIHDASPFIYLEYEKTLEDLKAEGSEYFKALIKKYLLNNTHASKVALYPKVGLEKEIEEEVTKRLADFKASLSEAELQKLIDETKAFNAFQDKEEEPEATLCIPLLKREDLRREAKYPTFTTRQVNDTEYVVSPIFTNKIAYINWFIKLNGIEDKYVPYLGMIVGMLGKLDTANFTYEALSSYMDEHIGSMSFHIQALNSSKDDKKYLPIFTIQSKALLSEVEEQVKLMREVLMHTSFEHKERLLEIIREMKALMESSISGDGHRVAYGRLLAHLSSAEHFEEKARGLAFYHFVCDLEKNWEQVQDETVAYLKEAYSFLANRNRLVVGLTVDEDVTEEVVQKIDQEISQIPVSEVDTFNQDFEITKEQEALVYPSNVNYVAAGYNFKALGYEYNGGLQMLKTILSMAFLWTRVRVQNGAYGCFCDFRKSGNMFFVSYRDPNLDQTLDIYKEVADFVEHMELSERESLQYLIGTISQMDFPFTPVTEGKTGQIYHLMNIEKEDLQKTRDELFATTVDTLRSFAPMIRACIDQNHYCVFSNAQAIEQAQTTFEVKTTV